MTSPITQQELEALYASCAAALDDGDYEQWLASFAESCAYSITSRENLERGWPIALLTCENRGMMRDRIMAIQETLFYAPRIQRRIQSGIRVTRVEGAITHSRASFAVFETIAGEHTTLFATGSFLDMVSRDGESLRFVRRTCVLDASLVPNSLPFPL